jgi:single-strand DNA-binding protein
LTASARLRHALGTRREAPADTTDERNRTGKRPGPLEAEEALMNDTTITIVGNLTDDPELRFTPDSGAAVAKFRLASTPRYLDKTVGEWKDGEPLFLSCTVWRQAAENLAESLQRGSRVIVTGRLRQRAYETRDGEKRTVIELDVDEVGPSLRYATAKVQRLERANPGAAITAEDPWVTAATSPLTAAEALV